MINHNIYKYWYNKHSKSYYGSLIMNRKIILILGLVAIYYSARYQFYGTFMSHAYIAKTLIPYYSPQPKHLLTIWLNVGIVPVVLAVWGTCISDKFNWLFVYIGLSFITCMFGLSSDWGRYSVHLLPLMMMCGLPVIAHFLRQENRR